jgi:hypothetical protein
MEAALRDPDLIYRAVYSGGADLSTAAALASVGVPAPAEGQAALVDAAMWVEWSAGAKLDAHARLEAGTSVLATAYCYLDATAGSLGCTLAATHQPRDATIYRLVLEATSGQTAVTAQNVSLSVRHAVIVSPSVDVTALPQNPKQPIVDPNRAEFSLGIAGEASYTPVRLSGAGVGLGLGVAGVATYVADHGAGQWYAAGAMSLRAAVQDHPEGRRHGRQQ